ncbi:VOC family protein [Xylanimonas oleitrophica]|uniref:VOC family protein n=1 Tax=Xylanimonas oleitrophica TaxID=2607479 RepID=A0A2W5WNZ6_9MICO|nr:VOC family protein [Xylanimonas oleitrophica]PZR53087.1 VOC family protein [Xylanimonas oleitrophica]
MAGAYPTVSQVVLDTTDVRGLAEFYRELLGLEYREGDQPPGAGEADDADWLVLRNPGGVQLAFQEVEALSPSTWPSDEVPQQLHLDCTVADVEELDAQTDRALALGALLLLDVSDDEEEPLRVFADPAGHPFCLFVA